MAEPPKVTRYCGHVDDAVMYRGEMNRQRFMVSVWDAEMIDVNIAQANAIARMLGEVT